MSLMMFQGISSFAWKRKSNLILETISKFEEALGFSIIGDILDTDNNYIALSNRYQCKLVSEPDDNVYGKKRNECINPLRYLNAAFFSRQQFKYLQYRTAVSGNGHCFFCASTDTQPVSFVAAMLQKERAKGKGKRKGRDTREGIAEVYSRGTVRQRVYNKTI